MPNRLTTIDRASNTWKMLRTLSMPPRPVTIHTADRVGDILKYAGPDDPVAARYAFHTWPARPDMPGPPTALLILGPKTADAALAGGRDHFWFA